MVCWLYVKALQQQVTPWELLSALSRQGKLQRIRLVTIFPQYSDVETKGLYIINSRTWWWCTQVAGNRLEYKLTICPTSPHREQWCAGEAWVASIPKAWAQVSRGHMPETAHLFPRTHRWHYCPTSCPTFPEKSAQSAHGVKKGERHHMIQCSKCPRCSHCSKWGEGRWNKQVTRSALEM